MKIVSNSVEIAISVRIVPLIQNLITVLVGRQNKNIVLRSTARAIFTARSMNNRPRVRVLHGKVEYKIGRDVEQSEAITATTRIHTTNVWISLFM
jgi:hypothetical protein